MRPGVAVPVLEPFSECLSRRLCDAQASDAVLAPDVVPFAQVTCPSETPDGLHAPGLSFRGQTSDGVMSAAVGFGHLLAGFDIHRLTQLAATLLDQPYSTRQATYDLRRLPHSNRYQLTPGPTSHGLVHQEVRARPGPRPPATRPSPAPDLAARSPLGTAYRRLERF